jgi:tetratricopeptide (TPR) repeat protein
VRFAARAFFMPGAKRFARMADVLSKDPPMDHPRDLDHLLAEGMAASREGQRDSALALFRRASEADPDSALPHFLLASEQASAGDFAQAELSFANALLLAPDFALARYQLGLLQFSSSRAPVALLTWQPLFELPETDALLHFVRGFAALAQNAFAESLAHFRTGLACQPANPALCSDIVQVVEAVQRLEDGTAATEEEPTDAHVLLSAYARGLH